MKSSKLAALRTRRILLRDKMNIPDGFNALLVGDISEVLSHYLELSEPFVKLKISITEEGNYEILIKAMAERIKDVPICLPAPE